MVEINPETRKTRKERLATVIAIFASTFFHIFVFIGGLQFYRWVEETEKEERLMVVRRIAETSPRPRSAEQKVPSRRQAPKEGVATEEAPEAPEGKELSDGIEEELLGGEEEETVSAEEPKEVENVISVVTDLSSATFTVQGPVEHTGSGTLWMRKGLPAGEYSATFHSVAGYRTPPIQKKNLAEGGSLVFVGRYTKSVEVVVSVNDVPGASFEIIRPDGLKLDMSTPGRAFFDNLKPGNYTIVFHDVRGHITPSSQTKRLEKDAARLEFAGRYVSREVAQAERAKAEYTKAEVALDRRVQIIVQSYPPTSIEEDFDTINYPEIIIRRSNFQRGWCQVYLVIHTDRHGNINSIEITRPGPEDRSQYGLLIAVVEKSVRRWKFEKTAAEVHVDVRFYVE